MYLAKFPLANRPEVGSLVFFALASDPNTLRLVGKVERLRGNRCQVMVLNDSGGMTFGLADGVAKPYAVEYRLVVIQPRSEMANLYHNHTTWLRKAQSFLDLQQATEQASPEKKELIDEKAGIDKKIGALTRFLQKEDQVSLTGVDRDLLIQQEEALQTLSDILAQRIERMR